MRALALVVLLAACSVPAAPPPPVRQGKCVVDIFVQDRATRQRCVYQGQLFDCQMETCRRVGEAPAERPR